MTVEVSEDRVKPALQAAAREISRRHPVRGFRPGKAPLEYVVREYGERAVYEMALEDLGQKVYAEALDQEKIEAYGPGSMVEMQLKPLVLKFVVPLKPIVDLGDYRALRVPYTAPTVSEDEVQRVLNNLRERQAVLEPVERPAQLGDVVTLDINAFLGEGLNPSDFLMTDKDVALQLDENGDWPMPGFPQKMIGIAAGETRKFDLVFADDYANESLRGQTAHFEVTAKEVKQRSLPELNDDFAREVGDFQTFEELQNRVREDLRRQVERVTEREYSDAVLNQLVAQSTIVYPPHLLEQELQDLLEDLDRRLREQNLTLDDYLKIEGKTQEQLKEENRSRAEERLKRALVLGRIVEAERIEVTPEEVKAEIDRQSAFFGDQAGRVLQILKSDQGRQSLVIEMLTNKAVQRLMAIARGEAPPLPSDAPLDSPEAAPAEAPAESGAAASA
jgi:trigger factor